MWNGRRLDVVDELYAPDYIADYHEELLSVLVDGDRAALHLRITGTQDGAWGAVLPTGRRVEFDEMLILTFDAEGRVVHQHGVVDNPAALRQLGLIPAPRERASGDANRARPGEPGGRDVGAG